MSHCVVGWSVVCDYDISCSYSCVAVKSNFRKYIHPQMKFLIQLSLNFVSTVWKYAFIAQNYLILSNNNLKGNNKLIVYYSLSNYYYSNYYLKVNEHPIFTKFLAMAENLIKIGCYSWNYLK